MSWLDRIENTVFTIRTGDGKLFTPLWKSGETSKDFNVSTFDFIDQPGSLVARKKVKARKFPLTFWFQGADNIEQADDFDKSTNDNRAWVVRHPFYGDVTGQPISISRNDNNYNCTEITVDFWETIVTQFPAASISTADQIIRMQGIFHVISPVDYSQKVNLKAADISQVTDNATKINALISKGLSAIDYNDYLQLKNQMFADLTNLILSPVQAISSLHNVILQPAKFVQSVKIRINLIGGIYNSVARLLTDLPTRNNKAYFETAGGISVASLASALVNPLAGDYVTRGDVAAAGVNLVNMYTDYLSTLDNAYVSISDTANAFSASQETQNALQDIVIQTLVNLNTLAFNAKQERIVMLDKDSNLIVLTHKYMGLDPDDVNIETFRTINNIKNNYLFLIEKGTAITYYV